MAKLKFWDEYPTPLVLWDEIGEKTQQDYRDYMTEEEMTEEELISSLEDFWSLFLQYERPFDFERLQQEWEDRQMAEWRDEDDFREWIRTHPL